MVEKKEDKVMDLVNEEEKRRLEEQKTKLQLLKKNIGKTIIIYIGMRKIIGKLEKIDDYYNLYIREGNGLLKVIAIRKVAEFDIQD